MKAYDVKQMVKDSYEDPCFFVNYHNVGRGFIGDSDSGNEAYIKGTKTLNTWRIVGDKLEKLCNTNCGILFDAETYIFQWTFDLIVNDTTHEETLFYYWKGNNALKGYSPLPPEIEEQNPAVERICQWSEPALFFHMFSTPLVVFNGLQEKFNPSAKRLFMVRGELPSEIHVYEVAPFKYSLRTRGVFLMLNPNEKTVYFWYGSAEASIKYRQFIQGALKFNEHWVNYKTVEVVDGFEDNLFLQSLDGQIGDYIKLPPLNDFTPRLFYFNSITGYFLATEIEYSLRSKQHNASFPFLQSHLYTADQPALFLLDNDKEIWLWEGWKTPETNTELFEKELELAKETTNNYAKEKNANLLIPVKHVLAGLEPLDFINIFPIWTIRKAEIQLKQ